MAIVDPTGDDTLIAAIKLTYNLYGNRVALSESHSGGNSDPSTPNQGKELTKEEKEALGISGGGSVSGTPNGFEPDDERFKQQEVQTTHRKNEIKELFEYNNSRSGIQIENRTLIEMSNKGNAKIFSGASEAEVKQYFIELTGNKSLPEARVVPGKGNIYTVKTQNGSFNLRDFSNSASETGKAWTIDIPRGIAKDTAPVEIKFLK